MPDVLDKISLLFVPESPGSARSSWTCPPVSLPACIACSSCQSASLSHQPLIHLQPELHPTSPQILRTVAFTVRLTKTIQNMLILLYKKTHDVHTQHVYTQIYISSTMHIRVIHLSIISVKTCLSIPVYSLFLWFSLYKPGKRQIMTQGETISGRYN